MPKNQMLWPAPQSNAYMKVFLRFRLNINLKGKVSPLDGVDVISRISAHISLVKPKNNPLEF